MPGLSDERKKRVRSAMEETQGKLDKELRHPEDLQNREQVEFYQQHISKLKAMLAESRYKDALHHFARNSRWGTCGDCPHDGVGMGTLAPELCQNTERYDHNLNIDQLADAIKREQG